MKIVHVTLRFDAPGGVETNVHEVTRRLAARGEEVEVFASDLYDESRWERRSGTRPIVDGVPVRRFAVRKRLVPGLTMPMMVGLIDALADSGADLVHAHSHRYGHVLQAAVAARHLELPLVVSTHYHPADRRETGLKRGLLRLQDAGFGMTAYRVARRLVVESDLEARQVGEFAPARKIRRVAPGIDLAEWSDEGRPPSPAVDVPKEYIVFVGRIAPNKGIDHLLAALARLAPPAGPSLVLMGRDWGERAGLERLAERLGVADRIVWTGHVADRADYRAVIRGARALVLPSEWEAYGLVLLDAMAAGTPIVATSVGAVPEVLEHGRLGRLVPYADPGALAAAIEATLADRAGTDEQRARARSAVRAMDWDRTADGLLGLYRELVPGR